MDDRFVENCVGAADAGLHRGAYHFFTLCASGTIQAQNFLRIAPPDRDALAPAVDLELAGNCSRRPKEEDVAAELMGSFVSWKTRGAERSCCTWETITRAATPSETDSTGRSGIDDSFCGLMSMTG